MRKKKRTLESEPRVYVHGHCGEATLVSDSIRRNYLADPYFYSLGMTVCATCGLAPDEDCVWEETGQRVDQYFRQLRAEATPRYRTVRWAVWIVMFAVGCAVLYVIPKAPNVVHDPWVEAGLAIGLGLVSAFLLGRFVRLLVCRMGLAG